MSQLVDTVDCSCDGIDLDTCKLEQLKTKLSDKATELLNSKKLEQGVIFKDLRVRICTYEADREIDEPPYAEITLVWDESESTEKRNKRIEKAKAEIDKDIERYEKKKAEKLAAEEQRKHDEVTKSMEVLVKAGYTVSK